MEDVFQLINESDANIEFTVMLFVLYMLLTSKTVFFAHIPVSHFFEIYIDASLVCGNIHGANKRFSGHIARELESQRGWRWGLYKGCE